MVSHGERILLTDLQIESWGDVGAGARIRNSTAEDGAAVTGFVAGHVVDIYIVDVAAFRGDEERSVLVELAIQRAVVLITVVGRDVAREWIGSVERAVISLNKKLAM